MGATGRRTILLVEDEAILAMSEKLQLEKYGYEVALALSGQEAVRIAHADEDIRLVLMDIDLGDGMDGTEAAAIILKTRKVPIVFLSSHTEPEIVETTEKITSYGYVVKNSGMTVLDASIKMAFKLFHATRELELGSKIIHERNQLLERILDRFPGSIFWKNKESIYAGCNTAHAKSAGFERPSELIGKSDFETVWKDGQADYHRGFDIKVMRSGESILNIEHAYRLPDGEPAWEEWSKVALHDEKGDISGVLGIAVDITKRKKLESELRESERRLNRAEIVAKLGNWQLDLKTGVISGSEGALAIYGLDAGAASFEKIHELVLPEYRTMSERAMAALLQRGEPYEIYSKIRRGKDGHIVDVHSVAEYDQVNRTVFGVIEDVTDSLRTKELLTMSNEMFQKILDSIPQRICWKDRKSVFLGCNRNFAELAGLPDGNAIIGKTDRDLPWSREETERFVADDNGVMDADIPKYRAIESVSDSHGREIRFEMTKIPLHDSGGRVNGILVSFTDMPPSPQCR